MRADYSRVTHPCAALLGAEAPFSLDLHVLGLPPAFVLSQDQTLQFDLFIWWPELFEKPFATPLQKSDNWRAFFLFKARTSAVTRFLG